jgi:hypothetical protein
MKILISALDDGAADRDVEVAGLNYDPANSNFWMHCIMGDDWFQRVNSCASLSFSPKLVRISDGVMFVVYETRGQVDEFVEWTIRAQRQVEHGYRTMRG